MLYQATPPREQVTSTFKDRLWRHTHPVISYKGKEILHRPARPETLYQTRARTLYVSPVQYYTFKWDMTGLTQVSNEHLEKLFVSRFGIVTRARNTIMLIKSI